MSKSDKMDANGGCRCDFVLYTFYCLLLLLAHYQSLYVVGSLEESLTIRGFRYHPGDLEASITRSHRNICGRY